MPLHDSGPLIVVASVLAYSFTHFGTLVVPAPTFANFRSLFVPAPGLDHAIADLRLLQSTTLILATLLSSVWRPLVPPPFGALPAARHFESARIAARLGGGVSFTAGANLKRGLTDKALSQHAGSSNRELPPGLSTGTDIARTSWRCRRPSSRDVSRVRT